jgi:hypothetical protein
MNQTYAEKLRDPRWQRRRLEIMERDCYECTNCGERTKELHVHHRLYQYGLDPWDYEDDLLTTLCTDCHAEYKDFATERKRFMRLLQLDGVTATDLRELTDTIEGCGEDAHTSFPEAFLIVQHLFKYRDFSNAAWNLMCALNTKRLEQDPA